MRKSQKQVSKRFEEMYQQGRTPWTEHSPEPLLSDFLEFLKDKEPQAKILDIGCGNGWISIKAAKMSFSVWGIDSSETAIEKAKEKAVQENLSDRLDFRVGDGLNLPYRDNVFDALIDRGFFHHILPKRRPDYFENIYRVLKPDSYIYLSVFSNRNSGSIGNGFNKNDIENLFENFEIIRFQEDPFPSDAPAHLLHFIFQRNDPQK